MTALFQACDNIPKSGHDRRSFQSIEELHQAALLAPSGAFAFPSSAVTARLLKTKWRPPPPTACGSRGLYLDGGDLFAFLVDSDLPPFKSSRASGLFISNTERDGGAFTLKLFEYRFLGLNHCVHGASGFCEMVMRSPSGANECEAEVTIASESSTTHLTLNLTIGPVAFLDALLGSRVSEGAIA